MKNNIRIELKNSHPTNDLQAIINHIITGEYDLHQKPIIKNDGPNGWLYFEINNPMVQRPNLHCYVVYEKLCNPKRNSIRYYVFDDEQLGGYDERSYESIQELISGETKLIADNIK